MTHIVYDHQIFLQQQYGGISRYCYELATRLAEDKNFRISVIAPFHRNQYLKSADNTSFIKGFYLPWRFRGFGRVLPFLLPLFYNYNGNAQIIHETYHSLIPYGKTNCRILTVHDMLHELFPSYFKNDVITARAKKASIERADHIICVSESTRRDLVQLLNIDEGKISVVYLGCSFMENNDLFSIKSPHQRPYFLYVGSRNTHKNFLGLCKAFSISPCLKKDFDIVVFGGGQFSKQEIENCYSLRILENVHQVNGEDSILATYYKGATALVYPSFYEGFGIPPLEAMRFGCPVVCSNTSSIPEVVGEAGIYFDPSKIESISNALVKVSCDGALRAKVIQCGYERLKKFSWSKCATETAAVYKKFC